jgi:hypothetical protein
VFGDCDRGKDLLTKAGLSFTSESLPAGSPATLTINGAAVTGFTAASWYKALVDSGYPNFKGTPSTIALTAEQAAKIAQAQADKKAADAIAVLNEARLAADPAAKKLVPATLVDAVAATATEASVTEYTQVPADKSRINWIGAIAIVWIMVIFVTMVYGPIAAFLVELFPTRIRYTSMSLPYHIGNGWFGGLLPLVATAMVATAGNIYFGLWFPITVALMTVVIGAIFLKNTHDTDIEA